MHPGYIIKAIFYVESADYFIYKDDVNNMTLLAFILLAYLLGSISSGVLASRVFQLPDPRTYGSKNPGATNVLRSGKKIAAALTLLGIGATFCAYLGIGRRGDCGSSAGSISGSSISSIFTF